MIISVFITDQAMQFNLQPESDHEREMLTALGKFTGPVTIERGADIGMCRGNYVRNFGESSRCVAITIHQPKPKAGGEG
jgi:hypothetical protein